jgi:hypothetical protein
MTSGELQVAEARLNDFDFGCAPELIDGSFTAETQAAV